MLLSMTQCTPKRNHSRATHFGCLYQLTCKNYFKIFQSGKNKIMDTKCFCWISNQPHFHLLYPIDSNFSNWTNRHNTPETPGPEKNIHVYQITNFRGGSRIFKKEGAPKSRTDRTCVPLQRQRKMYLSKSIYMIWCIQVIFCLRHPHIPHIFAWGTPISAQNRGVCATCTPPSKLALNLIMILSNNQN